MRILILILIFATNLISNGYTKIVTDHSQIKTCAVLISQELQRNIEEKLLEIAAKNPSELSKIISQIYEMNDSDIKIQYLEDVFKAALAEKSSAPVTMSPAPVTAAPVIDTVVKPSATMESSAPTNLKVKRQADLLALFGQFLDKEYTQGAEIPATVKAKFEAEIGKLPIESIEAGAWEKMLAVSTNPSSTAVGKRNAEMSIAERMSTATTNTGKLGAVIEKIKQNLPMPK